MTKYILGLLAFSLTGSFLTAESAAPPSPALKGVYPAVVTRQAPYPRHPYSVTIVGENLPAAAGGLYVAQHGMPLWPVIDTAKLSEQNRAEESKDNKDKRTLPTVYADFSPDTGKKLTFYFPTGADMVHGETEFDLLTLAGTGPAVTVTTFKVTLAYFALSRLIVVPVAVLLTALLFWLVLLLLKSQRPSPALLGLRLNVFQRLLLDPETNTYSLSWFQLVIWSAVSVTSYITLIISRSFVQGSMSWPDIPTNLPTLLFISAGTTGVSELISGAKGTKGGGPDEPNWADLISAGGVVTADRVQFFIWTVLGAVVFLFYLLLMDPSNMTAVPTIPEGFLQLMGVSSGGYLGTKLLRRPAAVLESATIVAPIPLPAAPATVDMAVKGSSLSPRAQWNVTTVGAGIVATDLTPADLQGGKPEIVQPPPSPGAPDPEFATELKLQVTGAKAANIKPNSKLTIRNPDGRIAEVLIK